MPNYPITIYLVFNPEGMCMHAYSSDFEAEKVVSENISIFGYGWKVEPVSFLISKKFYERMKYIFEHIQPQEDIIDGETGEVKKKKYLKNKE